VDILDFQFVYAGMYSLAARISTDEGTHFLKWSEDLAENRFESEAKGLAILRRTKIFDVAEVQGMGSLPEGHYLLLNYIQESPAKPLYWQHLGHQLAELHSFSYRLHGLGHNNYIGQLPQYNEPMEDGIAFFIEKRLKIQAGLALYEERISHQIYEQFLGLFEKLPSLIPNEKPALLHGDLWQGNVIANAQGMPCLKDPAVSYSLRESEIAFTHLFGGFEPAFYSAYQEAFPLEAGFETRKAIYNLYPLLVHLNLFGKSYLSSIQKTLNTFVK
jgi:fructosamine-3-kinase